MGNAQYMQLSSVGIAQVRIGAYLVEEMFAGLTFGFAPPANPALVVAVPTSMTMGWFKRAEEAPLPDPIFVPFPLMVMMFVFLVL